jgi:nucleoside-diphosphate-sugar epimerase
MKKKIIIIGKNGFIGSNLIKLLKKKFDIKSYGYRKFLNVNRKFLLNVNYVINCTSNKQYVNKKYSKKNDFDFQISKKIKDLNCKMIFLTSRKIYKLGDNLNESSKLKPNCNYSKNKLHTEKILLKNLKNRILILRISNLIGINKFRNNNKKIHKTFIDSFFLNVQRGIIFNNEKNYKDFLSINKFGEIIEKLINKKVVGIYNVSLGQKVYLTKLVNWLNLFNKNKYKSIDILKGYKTECFYLNNDKLMKKINIKNKLIDLEKDCKSISKFFFKKKNK